MAEKRAVKIIYPSTTIAVYKIPNPETKNKVQSIKEVDYNTPITIYGINKLYCERLGVYFSKFYKMFDPRPQRPAIDFRCLRFPGIISASTIPSGETSDYVPEMIHSAARTDWGWKPHCDLGRAFSEYLIPEVQNKYK